METTQALTQKIIKKTATVGIIGIGYVGSEVGMGAAKKGYSVIGFDTSNEAVIRLNRKRVRQFRGTNNPSVAFSRDIIIICVPTPVTADKTPDLRPLLKALRMTGQYLRKGQLVIIESTVSPGTTQNIALPLLEEISELKHEEDFFLSFSPERIDPGNQTYTFTTIPKVVGGVGPRSLLLASAFYKRIVRQVHSVSSTETAEMAKMLENTFRLINISFINEIAEYTNRLGIDIDEVIKASSTKPYGFLPHFPGPGVGGHCIPVDPHYLLTDAKTHGVDLSIVDKACLVNNRQPEKVIEEIDSILNISNGKKRHHTILLMGVAYKKDISDTRESPARYVWERLEDRGDSVIYSDPYVKEFGGKRSVDIEHDDLSDIDIAVLMTPHTGVSYEGLHDEEIPVLDTTSTLKHVKAGNIYDLFHTKHKEQKKQEGTVRRVLDEQYIQL